MEKEKEFFNKVRESQIDELILHLNILKDENMMITFSNGKDRYQRMFDDIFDSFENHQHYITMKKYFDEN